MNEDEKYTIDDTIDAVGEFIRECGEMAEQNWTPQQVLQLEWLFGAVLHHEDYAEYAERQINDSNRDSK